MDIQTRDKVFLYWGFAFEEQILLLQYRRYDANVA
jgi:hypothetical protein